MKVSLIFLAKKERLIGKSGLINTAHSVWPTATIASFLTQPSRGRQLGLHVKHKINFSYV